MRVLLQRVREAAVHVSGEEVGAIGAGLLLLVGFRAGDNDEILTWMADKILGLRVFRDDDQKMNRSVVEAGGALLVVSQFTLYGDARQGRRPSFVEAAPPDEAQACYRRFVDLLRRTAGVPVAEGQFGAMMDVSLINDGPVTLMLERESP
jgi:D-tyrosyl-tRNA(Tyr) deacylase